MISLGLDPGYAKLGLGIVERTKQNRLVLLHIETITTEADQDDEVREAHIWARLQWAMLEFRPAVFGYEDQLPAQTGARMAQQRMLRAVKQGKAPEGALGFNASNDKVIETVGAAKGCARAYGARIVRVSTQQAKIALLGPGNGHAEKEEVKEAVRRIFGYTKVFSSHGADGVAIAVHAERVAAIGASRRLA